MHIAVKNVQEVDCACDVLILPFVEEGSNPYVRLKPSVSKLIGKIRKKEFKSNLNEVLLVPAPDDIRPERILFLGLGKKDAVTAEKIRQAGGKAFSYLRDMEMKKTALSTLVFGQLKQSPVHLIEGALLGLYTYKKYKKENHAKTISSLALITKPSKNLSLSIRKMEVVASSVAFAKDLVNAPANDMTPTDLADAACSLKRKNLSVKVL